VTDVIRRSVEAGDWVVAHEDAAAQGREYFDFLAATDLGPGEGEVHEFEVVTHVMRPDARDRLFLRTVITTTVLASVAQVFPAAGWHEREAADLLGLVFVDNPDPRSLIFLSQQPALRRDFALQSRVSQPWPGLYEPGAAAGTTRRKRPKPVPGVNPIWGTEKTPGGAP
jgi:NADH-quinone oxidoreductase subunit C